MASYKTLKYEKEDGFVVITLNRPEALNALNMQMLHELELVFHEVMKDPEVRVFIYTGAPRPDGRPCFSAGRDLKEMAAGIIYEHPEQKGPLYLEQDKMFPINTPAGLLWARRPRLPSGPIWMPQHYCPKISIAAVDGVCTAGGIELALACDLILVSETAQISDMHVKNLGMGIGGGIVTANLAYKVGVSKALQLCLLGEPIDGKEAHRIGFADEVYPPDRLLPEAKEMARKIAGMRPEAVQMTKLTCRIVLDMGYNEAWKFCDEMSMMQRLVVPAAEKAGAGPWAAAAGRWGARRAKKA